MSLNISQLRERIARRFPDVEQVDDSIVRFTRKAGELPFAVYYLDIAQNLPGTPEALTRYQDRVIGSHYFEGRKSLQWNNYLYFVTSGDRLASKEVLEAKEVIERDRNYARKLVIAEEELDSVLTPAIVAPADVRERNNILSIWINRLVEGGLDSAILNDDDLPTRLARIESSSAGPTARRKAKAHKTDVGTPPFIRSLQLGTFRDFPIQRTFEFGTVNLIFGPNASGKTSLLEAIELFYCGRNKRNTVAPSRYELTAVLADGRTEKATATRSLQTFRDRNLAWYGQSELKTNNLYVSFAQFNFLDTDAAVSLTESASRIEEDLSKLLVGPDASKTWRDIERVHEAVGAKLHDLRSLEAALKEELGVLENLLKASGGIKQESDLIRTRVEEMIGRVGWSGVKGDKEAFASRLVEALSELVSIAQQAAALDWTESPVSVNGMIKYCQDAKVTSEKAEQDFARLEDLQKKQQRLTDAIERDREALAAAEQAKRLIDADVPSLDFHSTGND